MPKYNVRAAAALGYLKSPLNDVEIFVEDTGSRSMWEQIIRRLLPKGTRFTSVNQLGGRDKVIEACKLDQAQDGRRKIYIIDADFDIISRKRKPRLKFLYRLKSYCIENLLITEPNLMQIGIESATHMTEAQIRNVLDFKSRIRSMDRELKPLFILYAAVKAKAPSVQTVAYSVHQCLHQSGPNICELKAGAIASRRFSLLRQALKVCQAAELRTEINTLHSNASRKNVLSILSGKDYALPIFANVLRKKLGYRGTNEQLKVRLAALFDPMVEPTFSAAIRRL